MTLFSLSNNKKGIRNTFFTYIGVVIFCIVFGLVYERFSHGIVSNFMLFGFMFPLGLGLVPFGLLFLTKTEKCPDTISTYIYNAGVATLTVGSYFKGMLDIYGTTRDVYVIIYFTVGAVLAFFGLVSYIISLIKSSGK